MAAATIKKDKDPKSELAKEKAAVEKDARAADAAPRKTAERIDSIARTGKAPTAVEERMTFAGSDKVGTLRVGSKGEDVKQLQEFLGEHGYDIKTDSIFGPQTKQAVEDFQKQRRVKVDGVVGKQTKKALFDAANLEDDKMKFGADWSYRPSGGGTPPPPAGPDMVDATGPAASDPAPAPPDLRESPVSPTTPPAAPAAPAAEAPAERAPDVAPAAPAAPAFSTYKDLQQAKQELADIERAGGARSPEAAAARAKIYRTEQAREASKESVMEGVPSDLRDVYAGIVRGKISISTLLKGDPNSAFSYVGMMRRNPDFVQKLVDEGRATEAEASQILGYDATKQRMVDEAEALDTALTRGSTGPLGASPV